MNHSGTLYVVATPIGNLGDITLRALEILKTVALVAAEDTRHSGQLLRHYGISTKLVALHEHNERNAGERLLETLHGGKSVALVSDAGTPGISDPGALLARMARAAGIKVEPVPGPCAAIAALSAAGFAEAHFLFYGFLPASRAARRRALETLRQQQAVLVFYEAPHRVLEAVADLAEILGGERAMTFARELTKTFETLHTLPLHEAASWLLDDPNRQRGEFVLLVQGALSVKEQAVTEQARHILQTLLAELPLKQAVKLATDITGAKKNALYQLALELKPE